MEWKTIDLKLVLVLLSCLWGTSTSYGCGGPSGLDPKDCQGPVRPGLEELVCGIFGLAAVEDAGEELVEEIRRLMEHPLRINEAPADFLRHSVLFTPYQAAALLDYIERTGDLLSALELGQVDGFSTEKARYYAVLLDFSPCGAKGTGKYAHQLFLRPEGRFPLDKEGTVCRVSMRYAYGDGVGWSVRAGCGWPSSQAVSWPLDGTLHLSRTGRRTGFYLGDMNLRFGQGLAMWTGMALSGLPSVSLVMKHARGICIPSSYTGGSSVCGIGCSGFWKSWTLSGALGIPGLRKGNYGLMPAMNLSWYGRRSRAGHTVALGTGRGGPIVSSVDFSACIRGTDLFGEVACDWRNLKPAAVFGTIFPAGENVRLALSGRYYPSGFQPLLSSAMCTLSQCCDEAGGTLVLDFRSQNRKHGLELSMDAAWHPEDWHTVVAGDWQVRARLDYHWSLSHGWSFSARYAFKIRGNAADAESRYASYQPRQELRLETGLDREKWNFNVRTHFQYSKAFSFLTYAEGAWTPERFSLYLRQGFFCADHWEDRIYAYEKDLPQSFSVPAYYGRGCWTSFYVRAELTGWCGLACKASFIAWPWNEKKKPGRAGLKLMLYFRF